jgi:Fur family transcriptional regulator, ferric uptake regulator
MDKCRSGEILKSNGLKITKQRTDMLNSILKTDSIFTAYDLADSFQKKIDFTTIYRFLLILKEKNIIREIAHKENFHYYELACVHHPLHPHFICKKCSKIYCLSPLGKKSIKVIEDTYGDINISEVDLNLSGFCTKCK